MEKFGRGKPADFIFWPSERPSTLSSDSFLACYPHLRLNGEIQYIKVVFHVSISSVQI